MVSDTLKVFCNHEKILCLLTILRMLPDEINKLSLYLIKKLINHIILLHHYVSLVIVLLNIRLDCPDKHKHCLRSHALDMLYIDPVWLVTAHQNGHLADIGCVVSYTLHISNHLHRCRNCSKVSCYRLLLHEQIKAQALYLFLLSVYL